MIFSWNIQGLPKLYAKCSDVYKLLLLVTVSLGLYFTVEITVKIMQLIPTLKHMKLTGNEERPYAISIKSES